MGNIIMLPIGYVKNNVSEKKYTAWGDDISSIILKSEYCTGLTGLEDFSHATILFYLDKADYIKERHLQRRPQNREEMPAVGIFSQRCKDRANQIGITSVEIISVSDDKLVVKGLDAVDGTPVLDIKPYYPVYDKKEAKVPEWVDKLIEKYF
ncbi:TrmO family methyltransferase [Ruminococcus sp.]|uniref:SAM-dependent methyltransferase n=1 Tax=Ruminococcus sp. TaxID=41978 RepID=UPI0025DA586D|nr:TrmO family methyltransferase [Ruminococcus sp.]